MSENGVYVFQVCETDAVAATSLDDALKYYKDLRGLEEDDLYAYDEIETVSFSKKVRKSEDDEGLITVGEIVNEYWKGKPFIALTTGGY